MKITTKDEAEALVAKHGTVASAARAAGMPYTTFERRLKGVKPGTPRTGVKAREVEQVAPARSLDDFRREHDQTWKIRDGIKRLFKGGVYMTDAEFREAVGGNLSRWRSAADASEFRENRYRVGGEWLWASKETIRQMRQIRGEAV